MAMRDFGALRTQQQNGRVDVVLRICIQTLAHCAPAHTTLRLQPSLILELLQ